MMDDVVEHHAPEYRTARFAKELLAAHEESPGLGVGSVGTGGKGGARLGTVLVEDFE